MGSECCISGSLACCCQIGTGSYALGYLMCYGCLLTVALALLPVRPKRTSPALRRRVMRFLLGRGGMSKRRVCSAHADHSSRWRRSSCERAKGTVHARTGARACYPGPVDKQGRMRADSLPPMDAMTILCIQAGNVNTGSFDPADAIIRRRKRRMLGTRRRAIWIVGSGGTRSSTSYEGHRRRRFVGYRRAQVAQCSLR